MFASGLQRRANFAVKGFYASIHSAKGKEVLKERRKEFLAIADPQEFLTAIKKKGSGVCSLSPYFSLLSMNI